MRYRLWGRLPRWVRRRLVRLLAPTYTVGAAGVVEHDGAVLLVRLAYRRSWGVPGGLVGRGEQPAAAAVREIAEEVGVAIELLGAPTVVAEPRTRRLDIVFRCRLAPGVDPAAAAARSREVLEARWWPVDDLPELQPEAGAALRVTRSLR